MKKSLTSRPGFKLFATLDNIPERKRKNQTTNNHAKLPSLQRVNSVSLNGTVGSAGAQW